MIKEIIKNISSFLPLSIDSIEWNDPNLVITGKNWSFVTVSSWRIINYDNKLECGCYDKNASDILNSIKKLSIKSLEVQSTILSIDPIFIFSNGFKLEIFSTTYYEPWIFDFSSGIVYVASPSTER